MASAFDQIRYKDEDGVLVYKMFVDGEWIDSASGEKMDVKNPFDGSLLGRVQKANAKEAERALEAAYSARKTMAEMPAVDRARLLHRICDLVYKYRDELLEMVVLESGKPVSVAEGEIVATAERLRFAGEEAKQVAGVSMKGDTVPWHSRKVGMVLRQPLGVVLAISSFNYPLYIAVSKIAPALAAGNTVVLKPASDDPIVCYLFAKIMEEAGVPKGAFNVLTGSGSEIGDVLAQSPKVSMISFTGSTYVGQHLAKTAGMKKLHLELGGKAPALVLRSADLDLAAQQCALGGLKFSGQRCDAVSRIFVHKDVADAFVEKLLAEAKTYRIGDPRDKETKIGPLINEKAVAKVDELVQDAVSKGAKVLLGGKRGDGLFYEPTILDNVTTDMRIAWEETFGPVLTVLRTGSYEEMIKLSNESTYGLDSCVFTQDLDRALDAAMRLEDGTVQINAAPNHGVGDFPYGGDKDSGMDREGIKVSLDEMSKLHSIVFNPSLGKKK